MIKVSEEIKKSPLEFKSKGLIASRSEGFFNIITYIFLKVKLREDANSITGKNASSALSLPIGTTVCAGGSDVYRLPG